MANNGNEENDEESDIEGTVCYVCHSRKGPARMAEFVTCACNYPICLKCLKTAYDQVGKPYGEYRLCPTCHRPYVNFRIVENRIYPRYLANARVQLGGTRYGVTYIHLIVAFVFLLIMTSVPYILYQSSRNYPDYSLVFIIAMIYVLSFVCIVWAAWLHIVVANFLIWYTHPGTVISTTLVPTYQYQHYPPQLWFVTDRDIPPSSVPIPPIAPPIAPPIVLPIVPPIAPSIGIPEPPAGVRLPFYRLGKQTFGEVSEDEDNSMQFNDEMPFGVPTALGDNVYPGQPIPLPYYYIPTALGANVYPGQPFNFEPYDNEEEKD